MAHPKTSPILETAARLGLAPDDLFLFGGEMAKVDPAVLCRPRPRPGAPRLVLVSAITPTAAGEGKTTTSIGLVQALTRLGESACLSLREPSLGPVFGMKGGGTGGGKSEVVPADRINLHFTGDFHAITAAHNLLAAMVDNHVFQDNDLRIDPRRVLWKRVLDMNDRALRDVVIGLGGSKQGVPRETGFDITAASEVMAMLCLAEDEADLRTRIDRTLVAFTYDGEPVTAGRLKATGAMMALLRDALWPNLVRTTEGAPAFVHGGPFANIAHGCSSVIATRMALHLSDWAVTEAGFGFDLGAEKFFDIKLRTAGLDTAVVVLVATIRALKSHGGVKPADLGTPDPSAVVRGFPNMEKHLESVRQFCEVPVIALNLFPTDTEEEIAVVRRRAEELGVPCAASAHFARGGEGAVELARAVMANAERESRPFCPLYPLSAPAKEKIETVARKMYGAKSVYFTKDAERDLREVAKLGYGGLPVCMAKTQSSLSDDPRRRGRPEDFEITVEEVQVNAGAGFLVVLTGEIIRMPGLPKVSRAEEIDLASGRITGL
ncbi:MAG: formate--tetrahydrofolate ligase [Planctomycetes bacterium]|jgi:formate--tetrahydrofolate ligase|nr:formate--tetrahydrofolate ligase [Planctomycetota bacterium]